MRMIIKHGLRVFSGLAILCFSIIVLAISPASASDIIANQSYFEDPTSSLTFSDVQEKAFTPYSGMFNKGYRQSTFWFRFDLDPALSGEMSRNLNGPYVLRIMPSFLDTVEFYDPAELTPNPRLRTY